ncbi:MAG: oxygenase MpaB family protein, partial [Acidimicrobiales bacterium]
MAGSRGSSGLRGGPGVAGPDPGLFGPGSVAWKVHADPSALVGGLRALLLQALHPLAMAAVDQHSDYRSDPWGRLGRTTEYLLTVTYGAREAAEGAGAHVREVHAAVRGVDPTTGKRYEADDPELLAWVHNVMVDSLLLAYMRFGGLLSAEEADRYVVEMHRAAELVGLRGATLPSSVPALRAWLGGVEGLQVTHAARVGLALVLVPPMPLALRPLWAVPVTAALSLLPPEVRAMYGLPWLAGADPAVRLAALTLGTVVKAIRPTPPALAAAEAR